MSHVAHYKYRILHHGIPNFTIRFLLTKSPKLDPLCRTITLKSQSTRIGINPNFYYPNPKTSQLLYRHHGTFPSVLAPAPAGHPPFSSLCDDHNCRERNTLMQLHPLLYLSLYPLSSSCSSFSSLMLFLSITVAFPLSMRYLSRWGCAFFCYFLSSCGLLLFCFFVVVVLIRNRISFLVKEMLVLWIFICWERVNFRF